MMYCVLTISQRYIVKSKSKKTMVVSGMWRTVCCDLISNINPVLMANMIVEQCLSKVALEILETMVILS